MSPSLPEASRDHQLTTSRIWLVRTHRVIQNCMPRNRHVPGIRVVHNIPSLGDLLTARPSGLTEPESWAILCQAVQALQDLFLSDGASGGTCIPFVTPSTLLLSSRGRVKFHQNTFLLGGPPAHLAGYLSPEYRPNKQCSDTETEKMWIYALGETLKRATLTSHAATSRLSGELCRVLTDMTRPQANYRASLMHLLDVISEYCKRRQQTRPFSHIVMDLHQEAMAAVEATLDTPWGPPAMPELRTLTRNSTEASNTLTMPRRWMGLVRTHHHQEKPKLTREASTSMEDLTLSAHLSSLAPGVVTRPKSMCVPETHHHQEDLLNLNHRYLREENHYATPFDVLPATPHNFPKLHRPTIAATGEKARRPKARRNPVQRAASRLYRAGSDAVCANARERDCVGPEFVVRASLPSKQFTMLDCKGSSRKTVTVIMLNGQKVDVVCNPNTTTAGQLFELIIQKEHVEENFMLGLSALIAGDFVFLPSDTRICKAILPGPSGGSALTLFMRVRFFLPSLRGIRGMQARHLLYLQLRRSILEHQLPCSFTQLVELNGLALQAEFRDFNEREHGGRDYFLLDHYVPETMACAVEDPRSLRYELIRAHKYKKGLDPEKAEEDFILLAQTLPHYGGHFYTATWVLKDNTQKDVWLYISAQGINLYERGNSISHCGPMLYEMFEWRTIQTLCYSKHYLCILPHAAKLHASKLKKYKLKMDHKKSYFTFRLASLHHQFFLRLRTEYTSLQSLSQQFGIQLKDMKNETNSLYKLEALTNPYLMLDKATVNAETEFRIEFRASSRSTAAVRNGGGDVACKRSKSVNDFGAIGSDELVNEEYQNKENENPVVKATRNDGGLILDSSCLSGLPNPAVCDKRRGVKMGVRAFTSNGQRVSRSMEAVNVMANDDLEQLSLQSVSIHCSTASIPPSPISEAKRSAEEAYIIGSSIKSDNHFLPDFQETLSESLVDKLNNFSFADERVLRSVSVEKDHKGSLGMQITEGSDGKVYVQTVIPGGAAHLTGYVFGGDQIVAVDGHNLLSMKYDCALDLLKTTGRRVDFILSQYPSPKPLKNNAAAADVNESRLERTMNKLKNISNLPHRSLEHLNLDATLVEKHMTESCCDVSNLRKYNSVFGSNSPLEVPYHKHIRYEIEPELNDVMETNRLPPKKKSRNSSSGLNRSISKSCTQIYGEQDRPRIVDLIPKSHVNNSDGFQSLDRRLMTNGDCVKKYSSGPIALPRSLGLSRKWRGPVRYPVTPVKKTADNIDDNYSAYITTSDEEQVFI